MNLNLTNYKLFVGVTGKQHLHVHLAGGPRLLLRQRGAAVQADQEIPGALLRHRAAVRHPETGLRKLRMK